MAEGALAKTTADLALAITGVTGPVADDRGNPRGRDGIDCRCEFGAFPPAVLLDAVLRTARSLGLGALKTRLAHESQSHQG